jgi:hypothetical protein
MQLTQTPQHDMETSLPARVIYTQSNQLGPWSDQPTRVRRLDAIFKVRGKMTIQANSPFQTHDRRVNQH